MTPAQAPDPLNELVRKVDAIYIALFGMEGQPETGRIAILEKSQADHGQRIGSLERWQAKAMGAAALVVIIVEIIRAIK